MPDIERYVSYRAIKRKQIFPGIIFCAAINIVQPDILNMLMAVEEGFYDISLEVKTFNVI